MTWTYTLPITTDLDRVRFLISDTVEASPLVANEEIQYALDTYSEVKLAAACVLRAIAVTDQGATGMALGSASVSNSPLVINSRINGWLKLAELYDPYGITLGFSMVLPRFGGLSQADKDALLEDTDAIQPFFSRTLGDIPGGTNDGE